MFLTAYRKTRPILDVARKGPPAQTSETLRARSSSSTLAEQGRVEKTFRADSTIGSAFAEMERNGAAEVVQFAEDLPEGVRSRGIEKQANGGAIQAVYDPASGKTYIIASNIKPGDERGVFLHEVGVHMAVAQGDVAQMTPLVRRAQQIVQNGSANGDPLAQAAFPSLRRSIPIRSWPTASTRLPFVQAFLPRLCRSFAMLRRIPA